MARRFSSISAFGLDPRDYDALTREEQQVELAKRFAIVFTLLGLHETCTQTPCRRAGRCEDRVIPSACLEAHRATLAPVLPSIIRDLARKAEALHAASGTQEAGQAEGCEAGAGEAGARAERADRADRESLPRRRPRREAPRKGPVG